MGPSLLLLCAISPRVCGADFSSDWHGVPDRVWAGPEYWSNPLQDWRVSGGRLECAGSGGDRNVFLLTREIGGRRGRFEVAVRCGRLEGQSGELSEGWVGFKIGLRGRFDDYRDTAVRGEGLDAGMTTEGRLFIGTLRPESKSIDPIPESIELRLRAEDRRQGCWVRLEALDPSGARLASVTRKELDPEQLTGGLALACSAGAVPEEGSPGGRELDRGWRMPQDEKAGGNVRFWFNDWRVSGGKVIGREERAFGPVLFAHYTVSRGILKMTAQLAPVEDGAGPVFLQLGREGGDAWETVASAGIDPLSRTATFRLAGWDDTRDTPYRLVWGPDDRAAKGSFGGRIRRNPTDKETIVIAAFTGNNDFGFPHQHLVRHVLHFDPDVLVFTGDQVYEPVGGYGIRREPLETATLDYLRKWYIYGWAFQDLFRDRPAICLIDDHDVYHGNIWGAGGRATSPCGPEGQDRGGYCMDPEWVKMVHRTQSSHLPDPYDPTPVEQDIPVYYTEMLWGGVSFAAIEDRKWKSPPKVLLPEAEIRNGWAQNPDYDAARDGDAPGAELLGERQLRFLEAWAGDWSGGAWMKVVVSQTLFANVATLPAEAGSDRVVQGLPILQPGEYAPNDRLVQDHDSNGWPQSGRNRALRAFRKAFALHIAGDQHLGSTVQYGIDEWNDASFALCVPSVSNIFPRRWFPPEPGANRAEGAPRYTGEYRDGFGNRMTVHAVSNPEANGIAPAALNQRAPGYGIAILDRTTRRITLANWPRWVDPSKPGARPYPGWPVTLSQSDNFGGPAALPLPALRVQGIENPVVQILRERDGEIISTLRIQGTEYRPKVLTEGAYTLRILEPGTGVRETVSGVRPVSADDGRAIAVDFR